MVDRFKIESQYLNVEVLSKGAEICSVMDKRSGVEYIWQAKDQWPRHAPILFPVVGSLKDLEYQLDGKIYQMKHHGFARDMEFKMLHQSEHSLSLILQNDESTWKSYPFQFALVVQYTLNGKELVQQFRVLNRSEISMPVCFGGHPAFNADPIEEFSVVFSQDETCKANRLDVPLISRQQIEAIKTDRIDLDASTFDSDALVFLDLRSDKVSLVRRSGDYRIDVDFKGWPQLGIWSKPAAPFVCIEPWFGHADFTDHNKVMEEREDTVWIKAGGEFKKSFIMTFNS